MIRPLSTTRVQKRQGQLEALDINKIHRMVEWACEGIAGVSQSQVEMHSDIQFFDGMTTRDIQNILIKSAADLISEETPNYQYVAARLKLFDLRKRVWGGADAMPLLDMVRRNVQLGVYDAELESLYSQEQWQRIDDMLVHDRDLTFTYAGMKQVCDKYLVQDRITEQHYETPQHAYILIAAVLFARYPDPQRMELVKKYYDIISTHKISLPTPIIAGVRTPTRQFASCVLIDVDDSLDSIFASASAVGKYVAQRAGIGLGMTKMRGMGASIRGGEARHTGVIPFLKMYQGVIGSCSQGGLRDGAGTIQLAIWHWEIEDLIMLKNNQGTEDNRVRHLDYSIALSKIFYERYMRNECITLFSTEQVPELISSFGMPEFDALYLQAEKRRGIRKKTISARSLIDALISERAETGRIYINNIDHFNTHSSFTQQLVTSNLCQEISLPTRPLQDLHDATGEIATCILSSINLGAIKKLSELEDICEVTVRALDALIDYQNYPVAAAGTATRARRSLGIGMTNLAYYLARHRMKWDSDAARSLVHDAAEALQYYCLKASCKLAQEQGACSAYHETKYAAGVLPVDTYKRDIDEFAPTAVKLDWTSLRADIATHGLRNSTLTAQAPNESSSLVINATNGIEPPRSLISNKKSKSGVVKIVVPEYTKLKSHYELLWNMSSPHGYLKICAIIQKFMDQSISTNTSYNNQHYENRELPLSTVVKDLLLCYKWGIKTLYYHNSYDGNEDVNQDLVESGGCEDGVCKL